MAETGTIAKKRKGAPAWLITFADLMALLLALFVLLLTFSDVNEDKFREGSAPINRAFNMEPQINIFDPSSRTRASTKSKRPDSAGPNKLQKYVFVQAIQMALSEEISKKFISMEVKRDQVVLRFPSRTSFLLGKAELSKTIIPTLEKISRVLANTKGDVIVAGHTDDQPISTTEFASNWSLSSARAVAVVHYFLRNPQIDPSRISAQGYADARPLVPHSTPQNRAINRRVEISVTIPVQQDIY